jgi:predicted ATP-dependent endonuclease of OLD family
MKLPLNGFGISNFRSFGDDLQFVGPLKKINVIIGENNCGKSNISRFVRKIIQSPSVEISPDDFPQGSRSRPKSIVHLTELDDIFWNDFLGQKNDAQTRDLAEVFFRGLRTAAHNLKNYIWVECPIAGSVMTFEDIWISSEDLPSKQAANRLWLAQNPGSSGGSIGHWGPAVLNRLQRAAIKSPKVYLISAVRKMETRIQRFQDEFSYMGDASNPIIDRLAALSNPDYEHRNDKLKFLKIRDFVRTVLNDDSIEIEIPATKTTINIEQHGRYLPIETLGTGVFQAVMLAAEATIHENAVICIEEPEQHLHPEVQRQVMHYLANQTSNQYFVSTHSAHVMDATDSCVIGVRMEDGTSRINHPIDNQQKREICHRLGYRPSDLLQSNCLIWIEGPSDRIYLNHWIKSYDAVLEEGLHYSFSTYGGRVLSNFSADEDSEDDLLQLLPINRFPVVVIDSDCKNDTDTINSTKRRVKSEVENIGGVGWVTSGREIENYIPAKLRLEALSNIHKAKKLADLNETKFSAPLSYFNESGELKDKKFQKNKIASFVAAQPADLDVLDLKIKIHELVNYIRHANRLEHVVS